jgi:hypothetical protein
MMVVMRAALTMDGSIGICNLVIEMTLDISTMTQTRLKQLTRVIRQHKNRYHQ